MEISQNWEDATSIKGALGSQEAAEWGLSKNPTFESKDVFKSNLSPILEELRGC